VCVGHTGSLLTVKGCLLWLVDALTWLYNPHMWIWWHVTLCSAEYDALCAAVMCHAVQATVGQVLSAAKQQAQHMWTSRPDSSAAAHE
jgi:hypothetical protein